MTKREKSIELSPKHRFNPSLVCCPICGKENGEIALLGKLKDDAEAPRHIMGSNPCDECNKLFDDGYIAILEAEEKGGDNQRTGRYGFIKREAVSEEFRNNKILYMDPETYDIVFTIS